MGHGERIAALETEIETERRHLATRADLFEGLGSLESRLTWKFIVLSSVLQGLGVGVILYFLGGK